MSSFISLEDACMILAYLDRQDLLNCRLVCKSWNAECLSILRKSNHHRQILRDNIGDFIKFATDTNSLMIFPFHLTIHPQSIHIFHANIDALIILFESDCVRGLSIMEMESDYPTNATKLFEILFKVSQGLEFLDIYHLLLEFEVNEKELVLNLMSQFGSRFDNLKVLKYNGANKYTSQHASVSVLRGLLDRCSNLEALHTLLGFENYAEIPFDKLRTLDVEDPFFDPSWEELQQIQVKSPLIHTLILREISLLAEDMTYVELLTCFSNTLTSLTLTMSMVWSLVDGVVIVELRIRLPYLLNLKRLELILSSNNSEVPLIYIDTNRSHFTPSNLPSLETINIPIHHYIVESIVREDGIKKCIKAQEQFRGVKHVVLNNTYRIRNSDMQWKYREEEEYTATSVKENVEHLLTIFPSVEKLSVHVYVNGLPTFKTIMKTALFSPLSQGIKELEIFIGEEISGFGRVLKGLERMKSNANNPTFMTSVENIRFRPLSSKGMDLDPLVSTKINVQHFDFGFLAKHFPAISHVGIPIEMLGEDRVAGQKEIQKFREKYPDLIFDLSHWTREAPVKGMRLYQHLRRIFVSCMGYVRSNRII